MGVTTNLINKPFNPRAQDASPLAYNRAALYSGKALSFDGVNDEIDLDGFTMSGNTASFAFYLKADEWNTGHFIFDSRPTRLSIGGDGTNANTLNIRSGSVWLKLADISDTTNTNYFVITINGTTAKLFLNGQSFGYEVTLSSEIDLSGNANTALMSYSAGSGAYFNGQLSGFKIFNTALTAAQIADLYNNPEKIVPTGVDNTALKLWLPMMEGAGTTAYDGSGNGNHGTIAGATYVNGVGAPVAQTSVIDWNKNNNDLTYSQDFSQSDWNKPNLTITANQADPIGGTNAFLIENNSIGGNYIYQNTVPSGCFSVYAKAGNRSNFSIISGSYGNGAYFDLAAETSASYGTGSLSVISSAGNDWYRCSVYINTGADFLITLSDISGALDNVGDNMYFAFCQIENGTSVGPYVPTFNTNQPSPVLLPQGLTTGRDITGVNLFENVRKQGALNLDGSSWSEVHDNASVDLTDAITLEAWYYHKESGNIPQLIGKRENGDTNWLRIYSASTNAVKLERNGGVASNNFAITENAWNHIIATIDSSNNMKFYIGGVLVGSASSFTPWGMDNSGVLSIGGWVTGGAIISNSTALGQIAQPRIYNRALTAEEVQRNYNAGKNIYS